MLNKDKFLTSLDKFISAFGEESQLRMCIEEMSELTKEICKYIRHSKMDKSEENDKKLAQIRQNIIEETADVLICTSQIKRIFGDEAVEQVMNYKIERGSNIVDEYNSKHNLGDKNGKSSN